MVVEVEEEVEKVEQVVEFVEKVVVVQVVDVVESFGQNTDMCYYRKRKHRIKFFEVKVHSPLEKIVERKNICLDNVSLMELWAMTSVLDLSLTSLKKKEKHVFKKKSEERFKGPKKFDK